MKDSTSPVLSPKDTSVGVIMDTPSSFKSSTSSRMIPSPSDVDTSDWADLIDILRILSWNSDSDATGEKGPNSRSGDVI
jgi:hypothetical protein